MDCSLSPLFKNLGSFRTFAVLSCEPVAISLSLGEIVTELMPYSKRWTKLSTQDTARHSTKLITLYWQKFLTLSPDRSKSFYTQQEQQYVKWVKKIILNLLLKLFMSISDQRGNNKREHLSFFFLTTTFNNDNSFLLSHFTKHARINVSIWTTTHQPLHGLTQQQSTSNKMGLMLGQGKGTFAVAHWSARFLYRRSKQYEVATRQVFCSSLSKYPTVT